MIFLSIGALVFSYYVFTPLAPPDPEKDVREFLRYADACVHPKFDPSYSERQNREVARLACQTATLAYENLKLEAAADPNCRHSFFDVLVMHKYCQKSGFVWTDPPAVAALLQQINAQHE